MCGIVGFNWEDKRLLKQMTDVLTHRGPDDFGLLEDNGISLGQRRLSIIDLSKKGNQPIHNEDSSKWVICNGEIYNYKEIRKTLEEKGHKFYSDSDSEVIIHAYEEYGEDFLKLLNGMFGLAIWDSEKKILLIARDRLGIKPVFYYKKNDKFIFSSEVKSILQCKEVERKLNASGLNQYMTYGFAVNDDTMFKDIKTLLPGHLLIYQNNKNNKENNKINIKKYWDINVKLEDKPIDYYIKTLRKHLETSVKYRMISDVPVGAFLSGGLDSSAIVALMQKDMQDKMNTFCIGYDDPSDEFKYAKIVADHVGTNHHELHIDFNKITKNLGNMMWHMEIPYARPSAFNIYFLSQEAKKKVTVIPVGEGSDEIFGGYNRDRPDTWSGSTEEKANNLAPGYFKQNDQQYYFTERLLNQTNDETSPINVLKNVFEGPKEENLNRALVFELKTELSGLQLFRSDRMSMAHSIETRVPFLDHNLVEFGMTIPSKYKLLENTKKYILQKSVYDLLPKEIIERLKFPFGMPETRFYTEELKDFVKQALTEENLNKRDFINSKQVIKTIEKPDKEITHANFRQLLFLTNLELWHKIFIENDKIFKPNLDINKLID